MSNLAIQYVSPDRLRPYPGNARSHSRKQLKLIENSIKRFGFTNPILVTDDFEVIAGHGRLQAAKSLGMQLVPVVALSSLSDADKKALIIADNRIGLVIVDAPVSPVQQRNLERRWQAKVIDRTGLILEIFGDRAHTREGTLQAEQALAPAGTGADATLPQVTAEPR